MFSSSFLVPHLLRRTTEPAHQIRRLGLLLLLLPFHDDVVVLLRLHLSLLLLWLCCSSPAYSPTDFLLFSVSVIDIFTCCGCILFPNVHDDFVIIGAKPTVSLLSWDSEELKKMAGPKSHENSEKEKERDKTLLFFPFFFFSVKSTKFQKSFTSLERERVWGWWEEPEKDERVSLRSQKKRECRHISLGIRIPDTRNLCLQMTSILQFSIPQITKTGFPSFFGWKNMNFASFVNF